MDLKHILNYIAYGPKAVINTIGEELIVTLEGVTLGSVITDNAAVFKHADCKLALIPLKDALELKVVDKDFGPVTILTLISISNFERTRFAADIKRGNFNYERLQVWQLERLATHMVDFANLINKGQAVNLNTLHDEQ